MTPRKHMTAYQMQQFNAFEMENILLSIGKQTYYMSCEGNSLKRINASLLWVSFKNQRETRQKIEINVFLGTEKFVDEKIGLVLPANSPYLNVFNREIYRMLQMGFIQKWLSDYLPKKDRCSSKSSNIEIENHTVNLLDMQGCFLVLVAGIFHWTSYTFK